MKMFLAKGVLQAIFAIVAGATGSVATAGRYVDFNGDGKTDILFFTPSAPSPDLDTHTIWLVEGTSVRISTSYFRPHAWSIRDALADRNGDGKTDIVWVRFESAGGAPPVFYETQGALWSMDGTKFAEYPMPAKLAGGTAADFDGDGKSDILYRVESRPCCDWAISLMNGPTAIETKTVFHDPLGPSMWSPLEPFFPGTSLRTDFNGDGKADLLWTRSGNGDVAIWLMNGTKVLDSKLIFAPNPYKWRVHSTGDFNGDGKADLLWRNGDGEFAIWLMDGTTKLVSGVVLKSADWELLETGDFDGDGKDDILWWKPKTSEIAVWLMDGFGAKASAVYSLADGNWFVSGLGDFDGDGKTDLLMSGTGRRLRVWLMDGLRVHDSAYLPDRPLPFVNSLTQH